MAPRKPWFPGSCELSHLKRWELSAFATKVERDVSDADPGRLAHYPEAFHQLFADFQREFRIQATKHFSAAIWIHGRQFAHEFIARFPFRVATPTDTDGE